MLSCDDGKMTLAAGTTRIIEASLQELFKISENSLLGFERMNAHRCGVRFLSCSQFYSVHTGFSFLVCVIYVAHLYFVKT